MHPVHLRRRSYRRKGDPAEVWYIFLFVETRKRMSG